MWNVWLWRARIQCYSQVKHEQCKTSKCTNPDWCLARVYNPTGEKSPLESLRRVCRSCIRFLCPLTNMFLKTTTMWPEQKPGKVRYWNIHELCVSCALHGAAGYTDKSNGMEATSYRSLCIRQRMCDGSLIKHLFVQWSPWCFCLSLQAGWGGGGVQTYQKSNRLSPSLSFCLSLSDPVSWLQADAILHPQINQLLSATQADLSH